MTIKMSDVFGKPLKNTKYIELSGDQAVAAAHAINSHDTLVEQNKTLREALKEFLNTRVNVKDTFGIGYAAFDIACKNAEQLLTQTGDNNG